MRTQAIGDKVGNGHAGSRPEDADAGHACVAMKEGACVPVCRCAPARSLLSFVRSTVSAWLLFIPRSVVKDASPNVSGLGGALRGAAPKRHSDCPMRRVARGLGRVR